MEEEILNSQTCKSSLYHEMIKQLKCVLMECQTPACAEWVFRVLPQSCEGNILFKDSGECRELQITETYRSTTPGNENIYDWHQKHMHSTWWTNWGKWHSTTSVMKFQVQVWGWEQNCLQLMKTTLWKGINRVYKFKSKIKNTKLPETI